MREERRNQGSIHVGSASILVIFVLLCLTTFAVLSLVSANADYKLTRKAVQTVQDYYEADAAGQVLLAELNLELTSLHDRSGNAEAYRQLAVALLEQSSLTHQVRDGRTYITCDYPIGESQELSIQLELLDYGQGSRLAIRKWKVQSTVDWEEDNLLELWIPEFISQ